MLDWSYPPIASPWKRHVVAGPVWSACVRSCTDPSRCRRAVSASSSSTIVEIDIRRYSRGVILQGCLPGCIQTRKQIRGLRVQFKKQLRTIVLQYSQPLSLPSTPSFPRPEREGEGQPMEGNEKSACRKQYMIQDGKSLQS